MSLWSRVSNVFHGDRLDREIDEELQSHIDEAVANGRNPVEARSALGPALRHRETSRDIRLVAWLDAFRSDAVSGWRQLINHKTTSVACILSLALAMGATTAAFRLIDALLLRPLPVAGAERLFMVGRLGTGPTGDLRVSDGTEYPLFQRMRDAVRDQAELIAVSYADQAELTFKSDEEIERAYRQYVSGGMFNAFGLQPAAGRLLSEADDMTPGTYAYAVLSYDYWSRRFGRDPLVVGRTFRLDNHLYTIIGVGPETFTGTETGTMTDIFIPTMMHAGVTRSDWSWLRTLALLRPGVESEPVHSKLHSVMSAFQQERASGWTSQTKQFIDRFLNQKLVLEPASSGVSGMRREFRSALIVLGVLVGLVLLIASANVANLMMARAAARAREMAVRISIGAGRWRLVQLVMIESAWIALISAIVGGIFAWWAAPFVVRRINPSSNPARLALPTDFRVAAFAIALTFVVALLFGLAPALRTSAIRPIAALKGEDRQSRNRLMHALIAAQIAFCFIVSLAAGLFVTTSHRLVNQPTGFSANGVVVLDTTARRPQLPNVWDDTIDQLGTVPGVEKVALSRWPLLDGNGWNGFIWVNGAPTEVLAYFLSISPGWIDALKIPWIEGRDLLPGDTFPDVAIVNEAFAKQCFNVRNPVGQWFEKETGNGVTRTRLQVVGLVGDARYRNMREPLTPTAYVPFHARPAARDAARGGALEPQTRNSFIVRTSSLNPLALASTLRHEVTNSHPELRVSNIRTQTEINQAHTVRERLLAMLALFFAIVAVLLAGVGLFGVLYYTMLQRRRDIGIRIALGASAGDIARRVTGQVFSMVAAGVVTGIVLGTMSVRFIESLFYEAKATDLPILLWPAVTIIVTAVLAALPTIIRAVRIDPVSMLRAE
jgi:putative ABC transport system permease protein